MQAPPDMKKARAGVLVLVGIVSLLIGSGLGIFGLFKDSLGFQLVGLVMLLDGILLPVIARKMLQTPADKAADEENPDRPA